MLTFDLQHQKRQTICVLTFLVIFNGNKETVDFLDKNYYFHMQSAGNGIDQRNLVFLGFHFGRLCHYNLKLHLRVESHEFCSN